MTARQRTMMRTLVGILATAAVPILGWSIVHVDMRYVHSDVYKLHQLADSLHTERDHVQDSLTNAKLDDIVTRVRELKCGPDIIRGCR